MLLVTVQFTPRPKRVWSFDFAQDDQRNSKIIGQTAHSALKIGKPFPAVSLLLVPYFLFLGLLALLAQMVLPLIFPLLSALGFGSALVPLVIIYASLELGDARAPFIAGVLGLFLDLTSFHRLGTSVLILSSISALLVTQAPKAAAHTVVFHLIFVMLGTFAFLFLDYLFILVETTRWFWPLDVWSKITFATILNVIISPIAFLVMGLPPRLCGWRPDYELPERRYAR